MLLTRTIRKKPGVRFELPATRPELALPRMDVAAFAGFASTGPIGIPVAVEDEKQFRVVFGGDVRLAWNPASGGWTRAYLGAAVRDFFRNGGRRCWALRLAGPAAAANRFAIAGLSTIRADGAQEQARMVARCEGSWSDEVTTAATLVRLPAKAAETGDLLELADGKRAFLQPDGSALDESLHRIAFTASDTATVLRFDLWARTTEGRMLLERDLAFGPGHSRYWGKLPNDQQRFGQEPDPHWAERELFPLAGDSDLYSVPGPEMNGAEFSGMEAVTREALERDGLVPFSPEIFLDPGLATTGVLALPGEADYLRFESPAPRRLRGIHALLELDEPSVVAVPDALHAGWAPSPAPPLVPPQPPAVSPEPAGDPFLDCGVRVLGAPTLAIPASSPDDLVWSGGQGTGFVLEEAVLPDFSDAVILYAGPKHIFTPGPRPDGIYYYRVRGNDGRNFSDWSNGVVKRIGRSSGFAALNGPPPLLAVVQAALLRMCAARGDLFAVLSLPETSPPEAAIAQAFGLRSADPFPATPSYGAVYHPWLIETDEGSLRPVPPDGAVAGVLARRSFERGAWIGAANEPYAGVLGTSLILRQEARADWFDVPVNWIFREPRGHLALSALTLSADPQLEPINVRRLLMLLRRIALHYGQTLVFEPNDDVLRRAIERQFGELLRDLFERGAFAGRTPETSYQVVAHASAQEQDQGRLLVEIRVAPSVPLQFLTVRLRQAGERKITAEAD